mmetsp:Transcript_19727/g.49575  ORF Transcript_19727/g.49575 Transcript_19727/m.49575 type:complete len:353 (+) Transcript_19727:323-1381(+)
MRDDFVSEMVPVRVELVIPEGHVVASLRCQPRPVQVRLALLRRQHVALPYQLPLVVDAQRDMVQSLPLSVQFDEALVAEEVGAVFAEDGSGVFPLHLAVPEARVIIRIIIVALSGVIYVLRVEVRCTLAARKTLDDSHSVSHHVSSLFLVAVVAEALVTFERNGDRVHLVAEVADDLLHVLGFVRLSLPRGVRELEAVHAKEVLALLALQLGGALLALLAHQHGILLLQHAPRNDVLPHVLQKAHRVHEVSCDKGQGVLRVDVGLERHADLQREPILFFGGYAKVQRHRLHYLRRHRRKSLVVSVEHAIENHAKFSGELFGAHGRDYWVVVLGEIALLLDKRLELVEDRVRF